MLSVTNLTRGSSGSANSATTASITPAGNRLILVGVISARGSGSNITTPTVSGDGLTFVQIATQTSNASNWRLTLFRAMVAAPSSGALTIDFGGQTQDQGIGWFVEEITGAVTSGTNGADAVVQSGTGNATGTNTGLTITLSAFGSTRNGAFGVVASQGVSITAGSGFTAIGTTSITASGAQDQFKNSSDNTVDWTWGSVGTEGPGIAIEIKASNQGMPLSML